MAPPVEAILDSLRVRVDALLDRIAFRDWRFRLTEKDDILFLQVAFTAPDVRTGEPSEQRGRKWYLSTHMTDSEIVQTVYAAISMAEEHERREDFWLDGKRIFGPHWNVEVLAARADSPDAIDARQHEELSS